MDSIDFASLELLTECPRCGGSTPLNRLTEGLECSHCSQTSPVPASLWKHALGTPETELPTWGWGYRTQGSERGVECKIEWTRGRDAPPCQQCRAPMVARPGETTCACPRCGWRRPFEPVPEVVRRAHPTLVGFVSDAPSAGARVGTPISVKCNQCGAPLVADGSQRSVFCSFCKVSTLLDDRAWTALHPPQTRQRWWVAVAIYVDPRRRPVDAGAQLRSAFLMRGLIVGFFALVTAGLFIGVGTAISSDPLSGVSVSAAVWALLWCVILLWAWSGPLRRYGVRRRMCVPSLEVVGHLRGISGNRVTIALAPAGQPDRPMRETVVEMMQSTYDRLGGAGGKVRAWMAPSLPTEVNIEEIPTGLE